MPNYPFFHIIPIHLSHSPP